MNRLHRELVAAPAGVAIAPTHDDIARLAYAYWEARDYVHGAHQEDWLRAERELLGRGSSFPPGVNSQ